MTLRETGHCVRTSMPLAEFRWPLPDFPPLSVPFSDLDFIRVHLCPSVAQFGFSPWPSSGLPNCGSASRTDSDGPRSRASILRSPGSKRVFRKRWGPACLRAAHAVAAVEAAVACAAADGQRPAVVAGRGVALKVGELAVLLA